MTFSYTCTTDYVSMKDDHVVTGLKCVDTYVKTLIKRFSIGFIKLSLIQMCLIKNPKYRYIYIYIYTNLFSLCNLTVQIERVQDHMSYLSNNVICL